MTEEPSKSAIVTGAGYGIGRAVATLLATDGWRVVVVDRDGERAQETCDVILRAGGTATPVVGDVTQVRTIEQACSAALALAPLRGLVTCAAIRHRGSVVEVSEQGWKETLDVVLNGVFLACRSVIAPMTAAGGGSIVNVSSPDAAGRGGMVAYASAKAAVNALSVCMAHDHAEAGIRVNVVSPGFTVSGMTEHYGEERIAAVASRALARRAAQPEDPARLIRFLMSDEGAAFSGGFFGVPRVEYS